MIRTSLSFALRSLGWLSRLAMIVALVAGFGFALIIVTLRYWVLPNVENYRNDIAAAITRATGQRVTIGKISANWEGLRPNLILVDMQVFDRDGRSALALGRVENTLGWSSLVFGDLRFHAIEIEGPQLSMRRDSRGVLYVAGIPLNLSEADSTFSDWLLRQGRIDIRSAGIVWQDEQRGTPPLELKSVSLLLQNSGRRHQFGLRAVPPVELAATLDVRGDFTGKSLSELQAWRGELFTELDYADIAAWRTWLSFPIELNRGKGAVRMWLALKGGLLEEVTADVRLADVKTRLAADLPELELKALQGRVGWQRVDDGFQISTRQLSLATQAGLTLQPADFLLRLTPARERRPAWGELRANALDLEPLATLTEYLPADARMRERLKELAPRGTVHDVLVKWSGEWPNPAQYTLKGRFVNLGMRKFEAIPAFNGITGSVDGNEKGGTFSFNSVNANIDLPNVFRAPLEFDTLTAQGSWAPRDDYTEIKINNVSIANKYLAGNVYGSYHTVRQGPGLIDLTANLTRADARFAGRYIPVVLNQATRDWLDAAFLAGESNDVHLRLKGNLADFPFADGSRGIFQVTAKAASGVLDYARGWPKIDNIAVDLLFRGTRMEIHSQHADIYGAKLAKVRAVIPDLMNHDEVLEIEGEAQGSTSDFLRFIENSPVNDHIDGFTEGMRAVGSGKLVLKLRIPLRRIDETKVDGQYQFVNNLINPGADMPNLEQVNGRLEFTESAVKTQGATAQILGGPATVSAATQRDGAVRINVSGRVNLDNLRNQMQSQPGTAAAQTWLKHVRGTTDWRGIMSLRKKLADVTIESSMQGLASDLPAPFAKAAAELVPLRFERKVGGAQDDVLSFSYGRVVSGQFLRRRDGDGMKIERGAVSFGATPALPGRNGVWINGSLRALDFDQWRAIFTQVGTGTGTVPDIGGIDLRIGSLDLFGKRFSDLYVAASPQGNAWQSTIAGKEVNGEIAWRPQGKGRVIARLKNFTLPASTPEKSGTSAPNAEDKDLPAVDAVIDNFVMKDRQLGRLELMAVQQDRDWRIEKLRISNPDSTLMADGLWQSRLVQPRTQVNVKLEVTDIGKFLARFGHPDGVKRGNGKLEGALSWSGSPQSLDYPSLSGSLTMEAHKGQFVKLEPGIGKLLGILSLQALPRRITLDFRDVFSEGFEFDDIAGNVKILRGVASTGDLRIDGSAAKIAMSGEVDLAAETQQLKVKVTPALGQGVSLAGALIGGPVVGITTLIVGKVLQDPLDRLASYEYNVTGTWSEPNVSKVQSQPPQKPEDR